MLFHQTITLCNNLSMATVFKMENPFLWLHCPKRKFSDLTKFCISALLKKYTERNNLHKRYLMTSSYIPLCIVYLLYWLQHVSYVGSKFMYFWHIRKTSFNIYTLLELYEPWMTPFWIFKYASINVFMYILLL